MQVRESLNGELEFTHPSDTLPEIFNRFSLIRHGASVFMYQKEGDKKLVACFNPFDKSLFVMQPEGYDLAAEFRTKRFPVGTARLALDEKQIDTLKLTKYARDLSFPLVSTREEKVVAANTLEQVLDMHKAQLDKFYEQMTDLYVRCADFTPGKLEEYLADKKADKFCRLNLVNHQVKEGVVTDHVLMLDEKLPGKVNGVISATICTTPDGEIDVYFYDEIVDYFTQLSEAEKLTLKPLFAKEAKDLEPNEKEMIANIVNPKRMAMMEKLVAAARTQVCATIKKLFPEMSESVFAEKMRKARGFIRAADGRVALYSSHLQCSSENTCNYVTQAMPTVYADALIAHVKSWASENLCELAPKMSVASATTGKFAEKREIIKDKAAMPVVSCSM